MNGARLRLRASRVGIGRIWPVSRISRLRCPLGQFSQIGMGIAHGPTAWEQVAQGVQVVCKREFDPFSSIRAAFSAFFAACWASQQA